MANWEKLIEEHYSKKKEVDVSLIMEMIDLELENTFQSGVIDGHAGKRLSTKGKKKAGGDPFDEDPPKARSKSAPAGFGVLEEEDIDEATLNRKDLFKRNNLKLFLQKIKDGTPFELKNGGTVIIDAEKSADFLRALAQSQEPDSKARLFTTDGKRFGLGALQKTDEFGGKDSDYFVSKEIAARGQLDDLIKAAIKSLGPEVDAITIRVVEMKEINGEKVEDPIVTFEDVIGVDDQGKVSGVDPKSDFRLIRKNGQPDVHISHKDGSSPKDMQNWSGVGPKSGLSDHPEVIKFGEDIRANHMVTLPDGTKSFPRKMTIGREIEDPLLKRKAMFGPEYKPKGAGGAENVDLVAQGLFALKTAEVKKEDGEVQVVFNLSANHLISRIGFDGNFGNEYKPILTARYTGGRASFGVKNCRGLIYPKAGRTINKYI